MWCEEPQLGHLAALIRQLISHLPLTSLGHRSASSPILTAKGPGVCVGDKYQGARRPLGQVPGPQNNAHSRGWASVHRSLPAEGASWSCGWPGHFPGCRIIYYAIFSETHLPLTPFQ